MENRFEKIGYDVKKYMKKLKQIPLPFVYKLKIIKDTEKRKGLLRNGLDFINQIKYALLKTDNEVVKDRLKRMKKQALDKREHYKKNQELKL